MPHPVEHLAAPIGAASCSFEWDLPKFPDEGPVAPRERAFNDPATGRLAPYTSYWRWEES